MPLIRLRKTYNSLGREDRAMIGRRASRRSVKAATKTGFFPVKVGGKTITVPLRSKESGRLRAVIVFNEGEACRVYQSAGNRGALTVLNKNGRYLGEISVDLELRRISETLRGRNIGSIMLTAMEQVYRENGWKGMNVYAGHVSAFNFFLKNGFRPTDRKSRDFVKRYLAAEDPKRFTDPIFQDKLWDPDSNIHNVEIKLGKPIATGKQNRAKHAILVAGLFGRPKWHFIPKKLLEPQAQAP
ncbi:MAG: GNAT family N-acetyltransferase [Candidatus Diapherotrites archaeon]|nr:GNAT family N-acetyltransferase [Candidatus Diapherotrites archaeon]